MTEAASSTDDVWTVQRILQWTTSFLEQKNIESARLESELLLAHARNCQRIRLYTDFETALTDPERDRMREYVRRRANREPLAYITGKREFYGRDFSVGSGVLVPRPDTETLIDVCLDQMPKDQPLSVCEIGFGSGCISITLAKQRPQVMMFASDISQDAMASAAHNVELHDAAEQVKLIAGNGLEAIGQLNAGLFDGIVSNPPYIRDDEMHDLPPEVKNYEPTTALVSGEDGLDLIRELISQSPKHLKPGGWMALELDPAQSDEVAELFAAAGFENACIHNDLSGQDRVVSARWKPKPDLESR